MNEQEKYELVWDKCERYGKLWTHPNLGSTIKMCIKQRVPKGSSVMDFGAGNGSSLEWLQSQGYVPFGVDIATNATKHPKVVFADLRDPLTLPVCDYGMCTDVMEHIPTEDVDKVIENVAKHTRKGCIFVIARDDDKDGAPLGLVLHLTKKDKQWWDEKLLQHFSRVEVIRYNVQKNPNCGYALWAWK